MSIQRQEQLVALLQSSSDWQTASELADRLGVSTRSVRTYVSAINAAGGATAPIAAGPLGYRLTAAASLPNSRQEVTPESRRRSISRLLARSGEPIDVHELSEELFVSSATIEADLTRVRSDLASLNVKTRRSDVHIYTSADEPTRRQAIYRLIQSNTPGGFDLHALADEVPTSAETLPILRRALTSHLAEVDELVNDFAMTGVTIVTLIAHERFISGHALEPGAFPGHETEAHLAVAVREAVRAILGTTLPQAELSYLVRAILIRGAVPSHRPAAQDVVAAVRAATTEATAQFGVEPLDEEFLLRLSSHVERLRERSSQSEVSHNPLTRSLKSTYPLLFDVAVSVGSKIAQRLDVTIQDDEIAYLALHIGGQWERNRQRMARPSAVLVSPGYHHLHQLLRASIERSVGSSLNLIEVHAEADVAWDDVTADIVLTTVTPPRHRDGIVEISPFLTDNDIENVHVAIARARRSTRRAKLHDELTGYLLPSAFVSGIPANHTPEQVIRLLGERLVEAGAIDEAYIESTLERERASSTAFTPTLAVPHGQTMSASRTAVAIGCAETSLAWGEGSRVQVVALVAFSESDRDAFQTIFEQFVDVFAQPEAARRLVRAGTSAETFVAELAAIIDD